MSAKVKIVHPVVGMTRANVIKRLRVILERQRTDLAENTALQWAEWYHNQVTQMITSIGALDGGEDIVKVLAHVRAFIGAGYIALVALLYEANRFGFRDSDDWQIADGDLVRREMEVNDDHATD